MVKLQNDLYCADMPGSAVLAEGRRYLVKKAETAEEIQEAQSLRYRVFKSEQGRLPACESGKDADFFDTGSIHLLVLEKEHRNVVGTSRMRSGSCAGNCSGLYSGQEYRFSGLEERLPRTFEVGRSCVDPEFRNGAVVAMLWAGIAEVHNRLKFDYMLGCASLEHNDCSLARGIYRKMLELQLVTSSPHAVVRRGSHLLPGETAVLDDSAFQKSLPPLLKGYLKIGAKICGEPAYDRDFNSIDFPIWFDFVNLPEKYIRHFKVRE